MRSHFVIFFSCFLFPDEKPQGGLSRVLAVCNDGQLKAPSNKGM